MSSFTVASWLDVRPDDRLGTMAFLDAVGRSGAQHLRRVEFPASALTGAQAEPLGDVLLADRDQWGFDLVLALDPGSVAHVRVVRGQGRLTVATRAVEALDDLVDDLVRCLRDPQPAEDVVPLTFWSATAGGYSSTSRRELEAPAWAEIRANYAPSTAAALGTLMDAGAPGPGGLLLWNGAPGTGKSFAVRALARAWRPWCDTNVITDPELFFNAGTDHVVSGMLRRDPSDRWRLFVVEDSGEYLASDARARAGQAVSRILNLTDGLLGAGLRALVLVTTNEPLRGVHPALSRPGRCWAHVDFEPLPAEQACGWLERAGAKAVVDGPTPLAELYALARGQRPAPRSPVGFVRTGTSASTHEP